MGRQHIDRLSKKKALIKEFKSGTRVFGLSGGSIILLKAAIVIRNISSRRKEEQRFHPDDSNETTNNLPIHNFLQLARELKSQYNQLT